MYWSVDSASDLGWPLIQMTHYTVIAGVKHRGKGMKAAFQLQSDTHGTEQKALAYQVQQVLAEVAAEQMDDCYLQDGIVVPDFISSLLS